MWLNKGDKYNGDSRAIDPARHHYFPLSCFPPPTTMEDIKHQLSSLLKRPGSKPATFALTHKLLQDPKVVTAILGLLLILSVIFCES
jgi:hypothetical protein